MTDYPFSTKSDPAAYLLKAEHAEERGDGRMARAWRWMAERAKWPQVGVGWWWSWSGIFSNHSHCLPVKSGSPVLVPLSEHECESALADLLDKGEL